jgi:thiol:disulfide interchange protein
MAGSNRLKHVVFFVAVIGATAACHPEPAPSPASPTSSASPASPAARKLPWASDEASAFALARASSKGVLIDFSATWCVPCQELEQTFAAGSVYDAITSSFVPLKFDVSGDAAEDRERERRYGVLTLPGVVFISADGRAVGRLSTAAQPDAVLAVVRSAAAALHQDTGGAAPPKP